jgi:hypothetical protein
LPQHFSGASSVGNISRAEPAVIQPDLFRCSTDPLRELLAQLDADDLTPREALDWIFRLLEAAKRHE